MDSPLDFVTALDPFDGAESARLRRYVSYADELAKCTFLGEKLSHSLRMARGKPHRVEGREDDEALGAWLLRFRRMHLEGGQTSATFTAMRRLVDRHVRANAAGEVLRRHLRVYRQARKAARNGTGIQLHLAAGQIKPGDALDDWLNGVYFHDDEDRLQRVDALRRFGMHRHIALVAGRDLSSVYLGFSTYIVRPVAAEPTLCRSDL